jgi:hypothetical protein
MVRVSINDNAMVQTLQLNIMILFEHLLFFQSPAEAMLVVLGLCCVLKYPKVPVSIHSTFVIIQCAFPNGNNTKKRYGKKYNFH